MRYFIFIFLAFLLCTSSVLCQVNFMGYLVNKDNKKMKDVNITLYKGNENVSSKKWSNKFEYDLELETYYTLELIKEGFLPKRIAISTFEGDKGAEPFLFVMELIENTVSNKEDDTDFPAAIIEYKKNEGTFDFDEDYAKNLKREQKEANKKKKKEEKD